MANKRLVDIERQINDFFASEEFKKLALANGAYRDSCNTDKFCIYNSTQMESVLKAVNEKIKEFVDHENIFISGNSICMEIVFPDGNKDREYIGCLFTTDYGFGLKNRWEIRFDNEYIYYSKGYPSYGYSFYRIMEVEEKIFNMKKKRLLSEYKDTIRSLNKEENHIKKEKAKAIKEKKTVEKWEYTEV